MTDIWLAHHGILGQKWGVRRFQNRDGSLTPAGKAHLETAGRYAKKEGEFWKNTADDYAESARRYAKDNPDREKNWIKDNYDDPELVELIRQEEGKDYFLKEAEEGYQYNMMMSSMSMKDAKEWIDKSEKLMNSTNINDFSKKELAEAEDFVKRQIKFEKAKAKNSRKR